MTRTLHDKEPRRRVKFGPTPPALAEGALLAHATTLSDRTLKKGHRLTPDDIAALGRGGSGKSSRPGWNPAISARTRPR